MGSCRFFASTSSQPVVGLKSNRPIFERIFCPKLGKMGPNLPKFGVFDHFIEFKTLDFSDFAYYDRQAWLSISYWRCCVLKKIGLNQGYFVRSYDGNTQTFQLKMADFFFEISKIPSLKSQRPTCSNLGTESEFEIIFCYFQHFVYQCRRHHSLLLFFLTKDLTKSCYILLIFNIQVFLFFSQMSPY